MGDRAMCEIKTEDGSLIVYTHWGGSTLPQDAKAAVLRARPRWSDSWYATRIIVDQLTVAGRDEETGFGIGLKANGEDEYNDDKPSVVIDLVAQTLTVLGRHEVTGTTPFKELA